MDFFRAGDPEGSPCRSTVTCVSPDERCLFGCYQPVSDTLNGMSLAQCANMLARCVSFGAYSPP